MLFALASMSNEGNSNSINRQLIPLWAPGHWVLIILHWKIAHSMEHSCFIQTTNQQFNTIAIHLTRTGAVSAVNCHNSQVLNARADCNRTSPFHTSKVDGVWYNIDWRTKVSIWLADITSGSSSHLGGVVSHPWRKDENDGSELNFSSPSSNQVCDSMPQSMWAWISSQNRCITSHSRVMNYQNLILWDHLVRHGHFCLTQRWSFDLELGFGFLVLGLVTSHILVSYYFHRQSQEFGATRIDSAFRIRMGNRVQFSHFPPEPCIRMAEPISVGPGQGHLFCDVVYFVLTSCSCIYSGDGAVYSSGWDRNSWGVEGKWGWKDFSPKILKMEYVQE